MKIYILGNKGMLGNYVFSYFRERFEVVGLNRDHFDASNITREDDLKSIFSQIKPDDVVVNCIGTIKPQVDKLGVLNAIQVNSVFPLILANFLERKDINLYHITTDCVYSGLKGQYTEVEPHDMYDTYGRTKSLGEPLNARVIRTSIIGEEKNNKRSFLEWVKSEDGKDVKGFTNHLWNGVTCLELAKIIEKIIENKIDFSGVRHFFTPQDYSKKEMVELVAKTWNLELNILATEATTSCNRTLRTIYPINIPIKGFADQLTELKDFSPKLSS